MASKIQPVIRVPKNEKFMASYKERVLNGQEHPLRIEYDEWHFTWVSARRIALNFFGQRPIQFHGDQFSDDEIDFLGNIQEQEPQVEWAIDNSFDGLYIKRYEDLESYTMVYKIGVYLHGKHATYFRLKYGTPSV